MLLECLNGPIKFDGIALMRNFRINIDSDAHQARCRFIYIKENGHEVPYDIVVYQYTMPKMSLTEMSIGVTLKAEEYEMHIPINAKISYHFLDKKWKLSGNVNRQPLNCTLRSLSDLLPVLEQYRKVFNKK